MHELDQWIDVVAVERGAMPAFRFTTSAARELIEQDACMFAEVAITNPGLVSTLSALVGHLDGGPLPEPAVLRAYGEQVRRVGEAIVGRADAIATDS
ncbi:MAG: hypothetical protein GEU86_06005 [Actinophytocola sp.]|nr:hypothetical protein [Actinophytocola sp.]